ncbi:MAG: SDR family oxidoreductase [Spirochaetales bacterium]|nr:SDR family oxidoreductase [Spirochaetales bacterium]
MSNFQSSLKGKTGILTGGTSGFGFAMAKELLAQGVELMVFSADELTDASRDELKSAAKTDFEYHVQDVTAPGASESMVERTVARFGRLDFAIVNAGFAIRFEEPLLGLPPAKLEEAMRAQFAVFPIAFASLALAAARVMAPRYETIAPDANGHRPDSGAVVVTLSEASLCPLRDDLLAYAAAKHASLSVMESLAAVLGPKNIRVNGIAPGFANTAGPRKFYDRFPNIRADIEAKTHLRPAFIDPGAVVPAVIHLLTDNYVTGQVIALDGGYHIELKRYFQDS